VFQRTGHQLIGSSENGTEVGDETGNARDVQGGMAMERVDGTDGVHRVRLVSRD